MPDGALRICSFPGCTNLVRSGRCSDHSRMADRVFPHDPVSTRLYNSARWKSIRKEHLESEPYCRECRREGHLVRGNHVDHIEPHGGDERKFYYGQLQTLCRSHHARKTNDERSQSMGGGLKKFSTSQVKAARSRPFENVPDRSRSEGHAD